MNRFRIERSVPVPHAILWGLLSSVEQSPDPALVVTVVVRGAADGAGTVRLVQIGGQRVREEIVAVEPGRRVTYRLLAGAPVRDYVGNIVVEPEGSGSRLTWEVELTPLVPGTGWLLSLVSKRVVARVLDILEKRARALAAAER